MSNAEVVSGRSPWARIALLSLLAAALAAGWLVFALFAGKAGLQKAVTAQGSRAATTAQAVSRTGVTGMGTKVQVLYGTPDYYDITGQPEARDQVQALIYHVFVVTEENHSRVAPEPIPTLLADGRPVNVPVKSRLLTVSDHHRTRLLRFPRYAPDGTAYVPAGARRLELQWPDMRPVHRADHTQANPLRWDLPIVYPAAQAAGGVSPVLFLALTAGLFAALSPCLIQLTLYYLSTLAGVSVAAGQTGNQRWPVVRTALWFSGGVVAAYTLGGFLAGLVGNMLQASDVLGRWGQPIAVGSGAVLILMGIYTGAAGRAPGLCRLPLPALTRFARGGGNVRTAAMGFLISLGCLQCFGGAVFASLLLYVGSLGSPILGALMLFLFSLGVAVPFVGAALAWSRVTPYLERIERITPYLSLGASAIMILFGVLMVLDRFHYVSGAVLQWLPFLQS